MEDECPACGAVGDGHFDECPLEVTDDDIDYFEDLDDIEWGDDEEDDDA